MNKTTQIPNLPEDLDLKALPKHVAIIMDGNGRWAKQRGLPRAKGHYEGISAVHRVVEFASNLGIKYLTLYAFSTENWNRPAEEVDTLMYLIGWAINREIDDLIKNNVSLRLIGDIERLPENARKILYESVKKTKHCNGLLLQICLSYSGRWEITEAARNLAIKARQGLINPSDITEETFYNELSTAPVPDTDLLIRSGGDRRISNFLLWQLAYAELHFTKCLWPDFSNDDFIEALRDFQNRERRFGLTSEQLNTKAK